MWKPWIPEFSFVYSRKIKVMKASQLSFIEIEKIIYALELTYGESGNYDKVGMDLAKKISDAKVVVTAK